MVKEVKLKILFYFIILIYGYTILLYVYLTKLKKLQWDMNYIKISLADYT
jgi:hypothetical protein